MVLELKVSGLLSIKGVSADKASLINFHSGIRVNLAFYSEVRTENFFHFPLSLYLPVLDLGINWF